MKRHVRPYDLIIRVGLLPHTDSRGLRLGLETMPGVRVLMTFAIG
jgi:hypothetical protein